MNAQEYIESKLEELKTPLGLNTIEDTDQLVETIFKAVMSKKFRKYSANPQLTEHIREAIKLNVRNGDPINITFLHGAYKLWRLEESPEPDWAELFALMYYSSWVKPICEIYKPGVWFDFFVDDRIIPKLDNIPQSDVDTYIECYQSVVNFLKGYQPANLNMTITPVSSKFESPEAFDGSVEKNMENLLAEGLPQLSEDEKAMIELNVKLKDGQDSDPEWREKVMLIHNAYMITKGEPEYHNNRPEKIKAFTQPLPSGSTITVGTTKDSIMKFWIGVGVLRPRDGSFRQVILSPGQLEHEEFQKQPVSISGLDSKNFASIRVLSN